MVPLSQLEVLVVDCQATAAGPRGHLLELGWARVGATIAGVQSGPIQARLIKLPDGERIPTAVERITGISARMLQEGVDDHTAWRELLEQASTLSQQRPPTVVHFARFEIPFLRTLATAGEPSHGGEPSIGGAPLGGELPLDGQPPLGGDLPLDGQPPLSGELPLDIVCTHEIARRLLPDLPRRSLRALAGYFGRAVSALRRSADHVEATAFVWRELVRLLDAEGISTWSALHEWLAADVPAAHGPRRRRVWPIPRELRLSLPDAPGIYRLQRTGGNILYVGKASSLHHRVNSYFRHQRGIPERMLEMLSQVRELSFETTPSALEAALLEPDEIKRHQPPYNVALASEGRAVWFAPPDLSDRSPCASTYCSVGPFASAETLDQFAALAQTSPTALGNTALGRGRWAPTEAVFNAGYAMLCAAHEELTRDPLRPRSLSTYSRLLRLGTRLWREGRRDRDVDLEEMIGSDATLPSEDTLPGDATLASEGPAPGADPGPVDDPAPGEDPVPIWTPERVQVTMEWLALRAALARRRARWLTRLVDATVVWSEPGIPGARLIVIENGEITQRASVEPDTMPPIPPGHARPIAARHGGFTIARFDRLRVLTTELKRLVSEGAPVALRFGVAPALASARLAHALMWV